MGCEAADLDDVGDDLFVVDHSAGAAHVTCAVGTNFVGDEAVGGGVDGVAECGPEAVEGGGLEAAFEDGVLDAHAPVFADLGGVV